MVRLAGSEPATRCLEGSRSIQLSYRRRTTYCEGPRSRVGHRAEPGWSLCGVGLGGYCPSLGAANRVSGAQPGLGCLRSWGDRRQNDRYPPVRTRDPPVKGGLLVAGTTSDAGKSVLTAGLCRWLARQGVRVAPFKAQNMSLNSFVTPDGAEIGRAQAMQAAAAGIEPDARMNPVLLKPGAAGSPAEINLRATDIANLGLARAADLPVIVVTDIDRGGSFAALYGTVALLEPADQALIAGFVINKFRGARSLLDPGLDMITTLTGRPVLGVLPWAAGLGLDAEDSLALDRARPAPAGPPHGADVLRV